MMSNDASIPENDPENAPKEPVSRLSFLGAAAAAISASAMMTPLALAQSRASILQGEQNRSASNPGPVNKAIADQNPSSTLPPITDKGDVDTFWYSFDLAHRRIQNGGWTRQVTEKDLPSSKDLAGVNMRLTAGGYRELHWHTANEWAFMIYGNARVTVMNPDGTIFIGDVAKGDLWFFPAGYPHSIQGLGPDGCEFLLVFDEGTFSEYQTFLLSDWIAHTPEEILAKNFSLPASALEKLPTDELYIFQGTVPRSLEDDRKAVGGKAVESKTDYTFRMQAMQPTVETSGGDARSSTPAFSLRRKPSRRAGSRQARRSARTPLASQRVRVAVLPQRQRSHDRLRLLRQGPHHELPCQRCRIHPRRRRSLYREHRSRRSRLFGTFQKCFYADISLDQWIRTLPP